MHRQASSAWNLNLSTAVLNNFIENLIYAKQSSELILVYSTLQQQQRIPHHVDGDLANCGLAMLLTDGLDLLLHCWHLLQEHILQGATASGEALHAAGTYCWQWVDSLWEMLKLYKTHQKLLLLTNRNSNKKDFNQIFKRDDNGIQHVSGLYMRQSRWRTAAVTFACRKMLQPRPSMVNLYKY